MRRVTSRMSNSETTNISTLQLLGFDRLFENLLKFLSPCNTCRLQFQISSEKSSECEWIWNWLKKLQLVLSVGSKCIDKALSTFPEYCWLRNTFDAAGQFEMLSLLWTEKCFGNCIRCQWTDFKIYLSKAAKGKAAIPVLVYRFANTSLIFFFNLVTHTSEVMHVNIADWHT